ncbi:MAG: hypothetical protein EOP10_05535 [Proteobacteria bacterium]|nr:MAG: hypothetical protein EOP10_05535 [Pseudomonadota bacterium]
MFNRTREAITERFRNLALQLKYRLGFGTLPAVATHLACFLMGTLLFEPDSRGKVPHETLVPLSASRISGGVKVGEEYEALSIVRGCVLSGESFKLWWPEDKRVFAVVGKIKAKGVLIDLLAKNDTQAALKASHGKPHCLKSSSNVTIYP